jgi:hypothetical protein
MPLRHVVGFGFALLVLLGPASVPSLDAQDTQVTINVSSTTEEPIRFRGAVMFRDGRLQVIDGATPHTMRGRLGMAIGMFESLNGGLLLRVQITAANGSATAEATSIVIGSDVLTGVTAFARTLDR